MVLVQKAIDAINNSLQLKLKLCSKLEYSQQWLEALVRKNDNNSPLTTYAALEILEKEMGVPMEKLVKESVAA